MGLTQSLLKFGIAASAPTPRQGAQPVAPSGTMSQIVHSLLPTPHPDFADPASPAFSVAAPAQQRVPYVFNSPHSGACYPQAFRDASRLLPLELRRSEDVAVDELFADVIALGAPMLRAHFPRAWLDVNREPFELDPKLFEERLPNHANTTSLRVAGGLGTVPRLVAENMPIYGCRPSLAEALLRIDMVYRPYHDTLRRLISDTVMTFGHAVLIDCHSMPSHAGSGDDGRQERHDIIVGDRYGTACNGAVVRELMRCFSDLGYSVARNKPYAGGFITEHYGKPAKGLHAVQLEFNRSLYLDEDRLVPNNHFAQLRADIRAVMARVVSVPDSDFASLPLAAE